MQPRTSWWLPRGPSEAPKRETSWGPRRLPQKLVLFSRFSEADSWEWGVSRSVPSGRVRREGAARALVVSRPRPGFLPKGRAPFTHPWGPAVPRLSPRRGAPSCVSGSSLCGSSSTGTGGGQAVPRRGPSPAWTLLEFPPSAQTATHCGRVSRARGCFDLGPRHPAGPLQRWPHVACPPPAPRLRPRSLLPLRKGPAGRQGPSAPRQQPPACGR